MIKKIRNKGLKELFEKIEKNKNIDEIFGEYQYKDSKILVRKKDPLTPSEKFKRFYDKRRVAGLCIQCGIKTGKNPRTKKPYRYCLEHRIDENNRKLEKRRSLK